MGSLVVVVLLLLEITASLARVWPVGGPDSRDPIVHLPIEIGDRLDQEESGPDSKDPIVNLPIDIGDPPVVHLPIQIGDRANMPPLLSPPSTTDTCKCGRTPANRIVGGEDAKSGHWCWQAKVMIYEKGDDSSFYLCGGSVMCDQYILCAAHCFYGKKDIRVEVYLGAHKLFYDTVGTKYEVASVKLHPDYQSGPKFNDVALIKLTKKIKYTDRICSICMPTMDDYTGETCTITGWGALKSGGGSPEVLQEAEVTVISNAKCKKQYGRIDPSQICAAAPGKDACQGDSGGPMVHQGDDGIWEQVGIVSAGNGCADPNYAGLYANVAELLPWIQKNAKGCTYCSR